MSGRYILNLIRKYNVEPIIFIYMIGKNLYMPTPLTQLVTDKLCVNDLHLDPVDFCFRINEPNFQNTTHATQISQMAANYVMYREFILSIPSIIAAIFLGPWLDMHKYESRLQTIGHFINRLLTRSAPKIVLFLTVFSGLFEACFLLFNVFFFELDVGYTLLSHVLNGLTGGYMLHMTAIFCIAMKETPLDERTYRFTIIELFMVLPNPIANFVSSLILPLDPWPVEDQVRNYVPILLISISCYVICLLLVIFFIGDVKEVSNPNDSILKRASLRTSIVPMSNEYLTVRRHVEMNPSLQYLNNAFEKDEPIQTRDRRGLSVSFDQNLPHHNGHRGLSVSFDQSVPNDKPNDKNNNHLGDSLKESDKERSMSLNSSLPVLSTKTATKKEMFQSLFQVKNASAMIRSTLKRREEKVHRLLWVTILIYVTLLVVSNGMPTVMLLFIQKAYHMTPNLFMKLDSAGHLAFGLVTTFLLAYLHKIEFSDTKTILVGLVSLFLINVCRGLISDPIGLYLSYVVGSVYLSSVVACRGFVSKIIPENEIGTILSVLSVFFATSPVIGSILYTQTFRLSIKFAPGLCFIIGACLMLTAILMGVYLHIKYVKYQNKMNQKQQPEI